MVILAPFPALRHGSADVAVVSIHAPVSYTVTGANGSALRGRWTRDRLMIAARLRAALPRRGGGRPAACLSFDQIGHIESEALSLTRSNPAPYSRRPSGLAWKLAEAKAKFSEVVRLAAAGRPQRVTVRGRDAVVVVGAAEFDELQARAKPGTLHELLSQSPLNRLDFEEEGVRSTVRDIVL